MLLLLLELLPGEVDLNDLDLLRAAQSGQRLLADPATEERRRHHVQYRLSLDARTAITNLLETMKLYDRRDQKVRRDWVERIS